MFKSVLKGSYKRLPKQYSKDLNTMIRAMLNITAAKRPTCDELMAMPEFLARAEHLYPRIAQMIYNSGPAQQAATSAYRANNTLTTPREGV